MRKFLITNLMTLLIIGATPAQGNAIDFSQQKLSKLQGTSCEQLDQVINGGGGVCVGNLVKVCFPIHRFQNHQRMFSSLRRKTKKNSLYLNRWNIIKFHLTNYRLKVSSVQSLVIKQGFLSNI